MASNPRLVQVGGHELRLRHLLIIGILAASFSISFMLRSQPAEFGLELNEFDPFFNLRATQFMVDNGIGAYLEWHDDMSWYPIGRDVSASSQIMLHLTASQMYHVFGGGMPLYDFVIILPVIFGSLSTIVVFALVRVLGGTTAGLFASLFFAFSLAIMVRGTIGWFKSEPLGLFCGLLAAYLFISGIKSHNHKVAALKLVGAGLFLSFGLASWGGIQFFVIPIGIFFLALPLLRRDLSFLVWAVPLFTASFLLTLSIFERPGPSFILGMGGLMMIGPAAYVVASVILQKLSAKERRIRNGLFLLAATVGGGLAVLAANAALQFLPSPSFRYLNAINPFLTTTNPLVDSVAEHATTTTEQSFFFLSVLMIFAGLGVWLIFVNREKLQSYSLPLSRDMVAFSLIIGFTGVYVSSAFVRLEVFASISMIILASIGLTVITSEVFRPGTTAQTRRYVRPPPVLAKISFVTVIVALLVIPTFIPTQANWVNSLSIPPTILNGGTGYNVANDDWKNALDWIKTNTPEDAIVAAWWDYGYWITTMGERITLADNATFSYDQIQHIARIMLTDPDTAWEMLNEIGADYILIFVAANKIQDAPTPLYLLTGGGDESKKQWFIRIAADDPIEKYLYADGFSGTPHFWEETLLGHMIPFSLATYVDFSTEQQSMTYELGSTGIYLRDLKYPSDGDGPLRLAYSSETFNNDAVGPITAVLIYEVNKEYSAAEALAAPPGSAVATTPLGEFTIEFDEEIAPNTVEHFRNLTRSGFYDGTIFHRIIPGFVIQGGDPNTISGPRGTWGTGDPGYTIEPELSDKQHTQYVVSMARGDELNSAGSQFFVVLDDAPWLDGQYTIFGRVTQGTDVIDRIASLKLSEEFPEQPLDPSSAIIEKIEIVG